MFCQSICRGIVYVAVVIHSTAFDFCGNLCVHATKEKKGMKIGSNAKYRPKSVVENEDRRKSENKKEKKLNDTERTKQRQSQME